MEGHALKWQEPVVLVKLGWGGDEGNDALGLALNAILVTCLMVLKCSCVDISERLMEQVHFKAVLMSSGLALPVRMQKFRLDIIRYVQKMRVLGIAMFSKKNTKKYTISGDPVICHPCLTCFA